MNRDDFVAAVAQVTDDPELLARAAVQNRFLLNGFWDDDHDCGCLVGELRKERGEHPNGFNDRDRLWQLGVEIDAHLTKIVGFKFTPHDPFAVLEVTA